jgi:uncharacterized protein (TIGR03435 family)
VKILADFLESGRKKFLSTVAVIVGLSIVSGLILSTPCRAQSQAQEKSAYKPTLEFDVVSVKQTDLSKGVNLNGRIGISDTPDGFVARVIAVKTLVQRAYGVDNYQLSGGTDSVNSERYDIDAKFDSATADELQKLSPEDRILARQHMLQTILAERFKLTIHRENKDVQTYSLVVAKNGPKLKEVKLDDAASSESKGGPVRGRASMTAGPRPVIIGQVCPLATLAGLLTAYLHRPVIDRTGLAGMYDITLHWTADENQSQTSSGVQGTSGSSPSGLPSADPTGSPSIFTAIQEQLGLKLESAKGPVEFIVIDHVERPSGN